MLRPRSPETQLEDAGFASLTWQVVLIGIVWVGLCWLHWSNDGLWPDDAARHFANGQFWKDFLLSFRVDAWDYAMSYYARYPVIKPTAYPPVFYLAEAGLFTVFGPSPWMAKGLVLLSTLAAALYTAAWIRDWIAVEAGWAAALLLGMPAVVTWSHAVMLHMPALAFATAALYHVRRWLESDDAAPDWKQFGLGLLFGTLAVFTYFHAVVVAIVALAWIAVERRWSLLASRVVRLVLVSGLLLLVLAVLALSRFAPAQLSWVMPHWDVLSDPATWSYYLHALPALFSWHLLALALLGALAGLRSRRWHAETRVLVAWCVATYAFFSYVEAKEPRYVLFLAPPIVCLVVVGLYSLSAMLAGFARRIRSGPALSGAFASGALAVLLVAQIASAARQPVPSVGGFREVVTYVEELVPEGAVFYDGYHHGIFIAYLQANDPGFRRRVVLGSKLLYAYAVHTGWRLEEYAKSPEDVVERLRRRGGAQVVLVEQGMYTDELASQKYLREAVRGEAFELLRSFPIDGTAMKHIDVYRLLGPVEEQEEVDLPFPILGEGVSYSIRPIER